VHGRGPYLSFSVSHRDIYEDKGKLNVVGSISTSDLSSTHQMFTFFFSFLGLVQYVMCVCVIILYFLIITAYILLIGILRRC
jgi:hypothetical protein